MKATDLMIGDWVKVSMNQGAEVEYGRVANLDESGGIDVGVIGEHSTYWNLDGDDEILPIPLTPEILEKNFGMYYNRGGFHCYSFSKDEKIHYMVEDRKPSAAPDNRIVFCRVPGTYICDVNYVHELQHALRLAGIKKEIVL